MSRLTSEERLLDERRVGQSSGGLAVNTIGVDVGGTNIRVGLLRRGELIKVFQRVHRESSYDQGADYGRVVAHIVELISRISKDEVVTGVGISVSGVLSADRSAVVSNAGLDWFGRDLAADVGAACELPTVMENDGNCATWAEYSLGVGQGSDPFVLLVLGTGVGGGTVIDGQMLTGHHGAAGELGHLCVVTGGRQCPCGGSGCLEQYASGRALIRQFATRVPPVSAFATSTGPDQLTIEQYKWLEGECRRRLVAGDPWAAEVLTTVAEPIASAIAILVRTVDPALVAIGGGLGAIGAPLVEAVTRAVRGYPSIESRRLRVPIRLAQFGIYAGVVGAAMLYESLAKVVGVDGLDVASTAPASTSYRGRQGPAKRR